MLNNCIDLKRFDFRYNISFIDRQLGGLDEMLTSGMIFRVTFHPVPGL